MNSASYPKVLREETRAGVIESIQRFKEELGFDKNIYAGNHVICAVDNNQHPILRVTTAGTVEIMAAVGSEQLVIHDLKAPIKYGGVDHMFDGIRVNDLQIAEASSFYGLRIKRWSRAVCTINSIEGEFESPSSLSLASTLSWYYDWRLCHQSIR